MELEIGVHGERLKINTTKVPEDLYTQAIKLGLVILIENGKLDPNTIKSD